MKKINVLIIMPSLAGGGAEKVVLSYLENLDNKVFDYSLILFNANGPLIPKVNNLFFIF